MRSTVRLVTLVALLLAMVSVAGCSTAATGSAVKSVTTAAAPSRLLDPSAFAAVIAQPRTVTIDVHVPFEGKLVNTDLMIPYDKITEQASALPVDHAAPLAIYCRTGNMSAIAAKSLAALGYSNIVELRGGMDAWRASGRMLLGT